MGYIDGKKYGFLLKKRGEIDNRLLIFKKKRITCSKINDIIAFICSDFLISKAELLSKKRIRNYSDARKIISYLLRKNTLLSFVEIGEILKRDHSTIIMQINTANCLLETDKKFKERLKRLEKEIEPKLLFLGGK